MTKDYKITFLIIFFIASLFILASFQIAIINGSSLNFNIFLFLITLLVLLKKFYGAITFSWFSGFLIDTVHFSVFGTSSLVLLLLTGFLIIFQRKALLMARIEGILIISLVAVLFYHVLDWGVNNILNIDQGKLNFYFLNSSIIIEILLTAVLLLTAFKCLKITTLERIN